MQNQPNKNITIEAQLPVSLEKLAYYTLPEKATPYTIVELLDKKPILANYVMGKIVRRFIQKKKAGITMKSLEYDYMDSSNLMHGVAYFKVIFKGEERVLRSVFGKDKLFSFELRKVTAEKQKSEDVLNKK